VFSPPEGLLWIDPSAVGGPNVPLTLNSIYNAMGLLGMTMDPWAASTTTTIDTGAIYAYAFVAMTTTSAFSINIAVAANAALTPNENFVMLYDDSGHLLAQSAPGAFESALSSGAPGLVQIVLSTSPVLTAGNVYYMAVLVNGAPTPTFFVSKPSATISFQPNEGTFTLAGRSTGLHTSPPSTLGTMSFALYSIFMALD
jgi:hypothetical protein